MKARERLKELRNKSNKELLTELNKGYEDLRKAQFKAKLGELKDARKIKNIKKDIARILSVLSEKLTSELQKKKEKNEEKATR